MPPVTVAFNQPPTSLRCGNCKKTIQVKPFVKLRQCAKCSHMTYCTRGCERAHYQKHKKECGKQVESSAGTTAGTGAGARPAASTAAGARTGAGAAARTGTGAPAAASSSSAAASTPSRAQATGGYGMTDVDFDITLKQKKWLLLPSATTTRVYQQHVWMMLVDAFRLHLHDEIKFRGVAQVGSVYHNDNADSVAAFVKSFLPLASQEGLLPTWVTTDCGPIGASHPCVTEEEIAGWYGESMVLQMRIFASQVYGGEDPSGTVEGWESRV
ncbi:hypothetical protein DV735_g2020, partial [Chaetothyriales sp. CBS 134920]